MTVPNTPPAQGDYHHDQVRDVLAHGWRDYHGGNEL